MQMLLLPKTIHNKTTTRASDRLPIVTKAYRLFARNHLQLYNTLHHVILQRPKTWIPPTRRYTLFLFLPSQAKYLLHFMACLSTYDTLLQDYTSVLHLFPSRREFPRGVRSSELPVLQAGLGQDPLPVHVVPENADMWLNGFDQFLNRSILCVIRTVRNSGIYSRDLFTKCAVLCVLVLLLIT